MNKRMSWVGILVDLELLNHPNYIFFINRSIAYLFYLLLL